ncbi:hypothetical protein DENSPDRAFT_862705 [Dentipellis sp. KUC8613]|nr:hypothetical protein DENSPDRAFT_862705 [Dentipellis sp. KUC8613]
MDATSSDSGGAGAVSGVSKTAPKPGFRAHAAAPPPAPRVHAPPPSASPARGPPRINLGTKPTSVSPALVEDDLEMSYPPPTEHGCTALDIAYYFHPSTHWTEAWYSKPKGLPTPLQNEGRVRWRANTSWVGTTQTLYAGFLFADLSICWFSVTYDKVTPADPNDAAAVQRHAEYLPRPAPMDGAALRAAHDTYGEIVAAFAESFAGTGRFCARGECWDLANEALAHAARLLPAAPPVGSIARTHGHLIFKGTPRAGRWYGGDDRVRRGDVVEWRLARLDLPRGAYASFGNPDHTAVITADAVPTRTPVHGGALHPSELVQLEVVEQGVDSPPVKKTYPLAGFKDGEVWIYRPVGMQAYVGAELAPTPPAGVRTLTL